jgi:hypothetical protein
MAFSLIHISDIDNPNIDIAIPNKARVPLQIYLGEDGAHGESPHHSNTVYGG